MTSRPVFRFVALMAILPAVPMNQAQAAAQTIVPSTIEAADPGSYLADIVSQLELQWPENHTVNVVCHGHSVPAGYFHTPEVRTLEAYPHLLLCGLSKRFPNAVMNVIVTAIGGENSENGAERFDRDVLSMHPQLVTIDYGLNDRAIGRERAEAAWRSMITRAIAQGIRVILLTPTADTTAHLDDPSDPLNQHAEQIRKLASEYQVGLVDSLEAFRTTIRASVRLEELMAQANHPNRKGHQLVADELLKWFPIE